MHVFMIYIKPTQNKQGGELMQYVFATRRLASKALWMIIKERARLREEIGYGESRLAVLRREYTILKNTIIDTVE